MSKIICDVCGTSYPEAATQCPICGCVRPTDTVTVNTESSPEETPKSGTYTYVKGGRFSKANVKKRNSAGYSAKNAEAAGEPEEQQTEQKSEKGLTVLICVLLLAIIAVVIYIVVSVFAPGLFTPEQTVGTTAATSVETTVPEETTEATVPCESLLISNTEVVFDKQDAAILLNVTKTPADTTDEVRFESADESVATVTNGGKIVAVAPGETVITVICGEATAECHVVCAFEIIPDESTEAATEPTFSTADFKLNREDFTMSKKGETWLLYTGDIPVKQIVWTSDNEKVVTIADGVVTAVGTGNTTVYGEYNGVKVSCIVRCGPGVGKYTETAATTGESTGAYNISKTDVTLYLDNDKSFELLLQDAEKKTVEVIWAVADSSICSVSGNTVTGLKAGKTTVSVTYEEVTYSCTVRVEESKK